MGISVKLVDICYSDYLTDHHNRDGELLIGVYLAGQSAEEMADAIVQECNSFDWDWPEGLTSEAIKAAALECLTIPNRSKLSPIADFAPNDCECPEDRCDCEQPSAWFLLQWS